MSNEIRECKIAFGVMAVMAIVMTVMFCVALSEAVDIAKDSAGWKDECELLQTKFNQYKLTHKDTNVMIREYLESNIEDKEPQVSYDSILMKVTAYCPGECCCGKYADGQTSQGVDAYTKGVAVDPSFIPYESVINIPGYGVVAADDCGGVIKDTKLDVRFPTHQEALNWGVRYLMVGVYRSR